MRKKQVTWMPTDHACRECGGRVVMESYPGMITGGGNPMWRCADCGIGSAELSASCICWCGFKHKGQDGGVYTCMAISQAEHNPAAKLAMMRAGYGVDNPRHRPKQEIVVLTADSLRWAAEKIAAEAKSS